MRKVLLLALVAIAGFAVVPGVAQAWTGNQFYSPTGNIQCKFFAPTNGLPREIACHTWNNNRTAWLLPTGAAGSYTGNYYFRQYAGHALQYGQTYQAWNYNTGRIVFKCHSSTSYMDCWSLRSGHGFVINRNGVARY